MSKTLEEIRAEALKRIEGSNNLENLEEIRVSVLGKKGELTEILKSMKDYAPEERPKVGQKVNEARKLIEENIEARRNNINQQRRYL